MLANREVKPIMRTNDMVELIIPKEIKQGTYDVYSRFTVEGKDDETIGIVIHVD